MDLQPTIDPKFAEALKDSDAAYKAEEDELYKDRMFDDSVGIDKSVIDAHNTAVAKLTALTKKGGFFSFLSQGKRRLKRQVEMKIGLHQERIKALQPFLEGAQLSGPPSEPLMPPVTTRFICLAAGSIDGSKESLYSSAEMWDMDGDASLSQVCPAGEALTHSRRNGINI